MSGTFGSAGRNLKQQITYWAPTSTQSAFGIKTYAAPVLIRGAWTDESVEVMKPDGTQIVSRAVVRVDQEVAVQGYLALGDELDTASPLSLEASMEIQAVGSTPDLRYMEQQRRAYL